MGPLLDWFVNLDWSLPATPRGVLVGVFGGLFVGGLLEAMRQRFRDVRDVSARLDGIRKARWATIAKFTAGTVVAVTVLAFLIGHDRAAATEVPAPATTQAPR